MRKKYSPPQPVHVPGTGKGEQMVLDDGPEPGRGEKKNYRTARDSTAIDPESRRPIDPSMPEIPPP